MQYYVDFDDTGNITGFYVDAIHSNIPKTAIPITETEWELYNENHKLFKLDGDRIREKTQQELDEEASSLPPSTPIQGERIETLETENADLWYDTMLKDARLSEHDNDIADLWYEIMTGGA
ncbi:hypothetical protein [Paenibacillus senegalensis]|uniref:hypothetical protein n=1 Tax=Paenibacillus senegalensis TaxID=1465766 RepID=UPI000287D1A1|nr:hypothetical protein [Paenibacillus senegalensis]